LTGPPEGYMEHILLARGPMRPIGGMGLRAACCRELPVPLAVAIGDLVIETASR
jgi:hypothetical protein